MMGYKTDMPIIFFENQFNPFLQLGYSGFHIAV